MPREVFRNNDYLMAEELQSVHDQGGVVVTSIAEMNALPLSVKTAWYNGELYRRSASATWETLTRSGHGHDAANINAGTLAIDRLPVGTASTQVAVGNHVHGNIYYTKSEIDTSLSGKADTHTHPYSSNTHNHVGIYSPINHTHNAIIEIVSWDTGTFAAYEEKVGGFARTPTQAIIGVINVANATNWTFAVGYPNDTTYNIYIRNQSGSSNGLRFFHIIKYNQGAIS